MSRRLSDLGLLVPSFRERVEAVLKAVRGQGYKPLVWETLRSRERAVELVLRGKSKAKGGLSMHCYGVAVDVVCLDHKWDCRRHHCGFFEALGVQAEDLGLTWGGRWPKLVDMPHLQVCPLRLQDKIRECASEHLDTLCRAILAGEVR